MDEKMKQKIATLAAAYGAQVIVKAPYPLGNYTMSYEEAKDSGLLHYNHYFRDPTEDDYPKPHVCSFPDTGLAKSWCSCGTEGYFSFKLGKYLMYKD